MRPLGFHVDDRNLRRAGLDYWQHLDLRVVNSLDEVVDRLGVDRLWCFSTKAKHVYTQARFQPGDALVFGPESRGLPERLLNERPDRALRIPIFPQARSLNLANAVAIAVYEGMRRSARGEAKTNCGGRLVSPGPAPSRSCPLTPYGTWFAIPLSERMSPPPPLSFDQDRYACLVPASLGACRPTRWTALRELLPDVWFTAHPNTRRKAASYGLTQAAGSGLDPGLAITRRKMTTRRTTSRSWRPK